MKEVIPAMSRIFVATLGFDEKFVVRFLLRHGVRKGDTIIVVVPAGYERNEKASAALENLQSLIAKLIPESALRVLDVDLSAEPALSIRRIRSVIVERPFGEVYACLSGGMRALIMLVVSALFLLRGVAVSLEVEFENFEGMLEIPLSALGIPRNERWLRILSLLEDGLSVRAIAGRLGLSPATVSRDIKQMGVLKLVDSDFRLTREGKFYLLLHS